MKLAIDDMKTTIWRDGLAGILRAERDLAKTIKHQLPPTINLVSKAPLPRGIYQLYTAAPPQPARSERRPTRPGLPLVSLLSLVISLLSLLAARLRAAQLPLPGRRPEATQLDMQEQAATALLAGDYTQAERVCAALARQRRQIPVSSAS